MLNFLLSFYKISILLDFGRGGVLDSFHKLRDKNDSDTDSDATSFAFSTISTTGTETLKIYYIVDSFSKKNSSS